MRTVAKVLIVLTICLLTESAMAYHPLSTEDPATIEKGHFELEWGNFGIWPENEADQVTGYLSFITGVAKGLDVQVAQSFVYWMKTGKKSATSGMGDTELMLKYRFLGDGDGLFNMGVLAGVSLPSGAERVDAGGDYATPYGKVFGTVGVGKFRVLMDVGAEFLEDNKIGFLYGCALEYTARKNLWLVGEVAGGTDFLMGDENDPSRVGVGVAWEFMEKKFVSLGGHWGIAPDADKFYLTLAGTIDW